MFVVCATGLLVEISPVRARGYSMTNLPLVNSPARSPRARGSCFYIFIVVVSCTVKCCTTFFSMLFCNIIVEAAFTWSNQISGWVIL